MDGFLHALSAVSVLLMLMSVGYFMGVKGWMTTREKRFVSRYIVNIAVPCNCVVGLLDNLSHNDLAQAGLLVASGVLGVGVTLLISTAAAALLHLPRKRWGVFVAMAGLSNTLFIGIPVCTQLFGQVCMPYVMLYYLANTIFVQSVGILLIRASLSSDGPLFNAGSGMRSGPRTSSAPNWLALSLKNGWNKKPASIITRRLSYSGLTQAANGGPTA